MKVIAVKPNPKDPKQAFVKLEDGTEAWTPDIGLVKPLVDKEVPQGWAFRDNKAGTGKVLLPPQAKGGPRWRDSKEAALFDQAGYERHQFYEQERTDRRTSVMQARRRPDGGPDLDDADEIYGWLRRSLEPKISGVAAGVTPSLAGKTGVGETAKATPPVDISSSPAQAKPLRERASEASGAGEDPTSGAEGGRSRPRPFPPQESPDETAGGGVGPHPPRRRCEHLNGVRTVTRAQNGQPIEVCVDCGVVIVSSRP